MRVALIETAACTGLPHTSEGAFHSLIARLLHFTVCPAHRGQCCYFGLLQLPLHAAVHAGGEQAVGQATILAPNAWPLERCLVDVALLPKLYMGGGGACRWQCWASMLWVEVSCGTLCGSSGWVPFSIRLCWVSCWQCYQASALCKQVCSEAGTRQAAPLLSTWVSWRPLFRKW